MKILYIIAVLSFVVLAWATLSVARHIRRSRPEDGMNHSDDGISRHDLRDNRNDLYDSRNAPDTLFLAHPQEPVERASEAPGRMQPTGSDTPRKIERRA